MKSPTVRGITKIVRQVLAERDAQVGPETITFRTLTIDFDKRTFGWDGETIALDGPPVVVIPVLNTEHPIVPAKPWRYHV